ncbi:MAG: DUF2142 domain-containing protein [Isosphaeraceae bacterium]
MPRTTLHEARRPVDGRTPPRRGPERPFAILFAASGLLVAMAMPPFQAPDESWHFYRAYRVSQGHAGLERVGEWGGGKLPEGVLRAVEPFLRLRGRPDLKVTAADYEGIWARPLPHQGKVPTAFEGGALYQFVPYLPQAAAIRVGRLLNGSPLLLSYLGRLANLAFGTVLVYLAIRTAPAFKLVFGAVAMIPVSLQQFASNSPDATVLGVAFLAAAMAYRLAFRGDRRISNRELAAMLALLAWLSACKLPYASLSFLVMAIPARSFGSRRKAVVFGLVAVAMSFGLGVASTALSRPFVPDPHPLGPVITSTSQQIQFVRDSPVSFALTCLNTITRLGSAYIAELGVLGWLDTHVNILAVYFGLAVILLLAVADAGAWYSPSWRSRTAACLAIAACYGLVAMSLYSWWTAVGAPIIDGIQGRYFLPVLPILPLVLPGRSRWLRVEATPGALLGLAMGTGAGLAIVTLASIANRYYVPHKPVMETPITLAELAALAVVIASTRLGARRDAASIVVGERPASPPAPHAPVGSGRDTPIRSR